MALRLKKDIKKASYYVWFLGAQESRGLRGEEFALPAIRHLEQRARDLEPFKVTLQVSHKGLKIIQNVAAKGKQQTIKHFIPHGSITSAVLRGDVVGCVLLLYNPVTGCPIHVHAYRCDSDRTADMLCEHLQALIDKPENQKKFAEIERKLRVKGALPPLEANGNSAAPGRTARAPDSSLGSELSRESDSGSNEERCVANLYDSLAAELKQKLSTGKSPILLPPRDYDTVHRQKGNLSGIDTRRCLNQNIVGVNARRKLDSSGGSSGIGSDLAPSPDQTDFPRAHDNHSTSEEDWNESTAYLMHEAYEASPPRRPASPRRALSPARGLSPRRYREHPTNYREEPTSYREETTKYRDEPPNYREQSENYRANYRGRYRHESLERANKPEKIEKYSDEASYRRRFPEPLKQVNRSIDRIDERPRRDREREVFTSRLQRGASEGSLKLTEASPKDRFNVAKEKFMNLERERFNRELEQQMAIRRSMLERNSRSASSPDREQRREELPIREMERLPRVGRNLKRFEYGTEDFMDRYERRERRELDRRIEEDEIIEPVIEERPRREWTDRQRAFSRTRPLDEHRQSYEGDRFFERDYRELRDLAERHNKFRHSYAEPIPRGRLGVAAVRPYS